MANRLIEKLHTQETAATDKIACTLGIINTSIIHPYVLATPHVFILDRERVSVN